MTPAAPAPVPEPVPAVDLASGLARPLVADRNVFADAACVGRWALFDEAARLEPPAQVAARHRAAQQLCRSCPTRRPCAELLLAQPPRAVTGVWAGRLPVATHPVHLRRTR